MNYKFRGMSDDGKWVYGSLVKIGDRTFIVPSSVKMVKICGSDHFHWDDLIEVKPETVGQWTGFTTAGKKIDVFDGDKWFLKFYSDRFGWITNQGIVQRQENGLWICKEEPGVNSFELADMIKNYVGAFEIVGSIHEKGGA